MFHHHFQQIVPWQVEKNSFRIAYQASGAATKSLDLTLKSYIHALQEQLETCQQLVRSDAGVLETITQDLALLTETAGRLPQSDRPAPAGTDEAQADSASSLMRTA